MRRLYAVLLRLYPREHNAKFAAEMLSTFEQSAEEHRARGRGALARFVVVESLGLIAGACVAWCTRRTAARELAHAHLPPEVMQAQARVDALVKRMIDAIANHRFEEARSCDYEERRERDNLRLLYAKYSIEPPAAA